MKFKIKNCGWRYSINLICSITLLGRKFKLQIPKVKFKFIQIVLNLCLI